MTRSFARPQTSASVLAGAAVIALGLCLVTAPEPARAAPMIAAAPAGQASIVQPAGPIFRRGRPPVYPYYYNPGRKGGTSFYFGFVPYEKGNYEIQALQRRYPESNWPPGMRYPFPRPYP
jgi:hypothetical protein